MVVVAVLLLCCVLLWGRYALRQRMDSRMHKAEPEERRALLDVQRDMDKGKAAGHGFFF